MVELVATAWNVTVPVAIRRLVKRGFPLKASEITATKVARYIKGHPAKREKVRELWRKSQDFYITQPDPLLTIYREKFRLASQMSRERWKDGPGNMLGAYTQVGIERTFSPSSVIGNRAVSSSRIFTGGKWSTVLVTPHHDLPGRICGFLFVGRHATEKDRRFKATIPSTRNGGKEGGLGCYWAVEHSYGMFDRKLVVVSDVMFALRLHIRHFATSRNALPLVSYLDELGYLTENAWASIENRTPVLWGWRLTPSLAYQAITSNGELSITPLADMSQSRIDHFVRNAEPRTIIQRVIKRAMPWKEYLRRWANQTQEDGVIEDLILSLRAYGVSTDTLQSVGGRFARLAAEEKAPVPSITMSDCTLSELDNKTWGAKARQEPHMVLNALLRIDSTFMKKLRGVDDKVPYYRCRLIYEGTTIPFETSIRDFAESFSEALEMVLVAKRPGAKLVVEPAWHRQIINFAKTMADLEAAKSR